MRAMTNGKGVRMRAKKNLFFLVLATLPFFSALIRTPLPLFFAPILTILKRIKVLTKWH